MKELDSQKMDQLENQFPLQAVNLVRQTYQKVLDSGRSVVISKNGALFRVSASSRTKIKDTEPNVSVKGTKFKIP